MSTKTKKETAVVTEQPQTMTAQVNHGTLDGAPPMFSLTGPAIVAEQPVEVTTTITAIDPISNAAIQSSPEVITTPEIVAPKVGRPVGVEAKKADLTQEGPITMAPRGRGEGETTKEVRKRLDALKTEPQNWYRVFVFPSKQGAQVMRTKLTAAYAEFDLKASVDTKAGTSALFARLKDVKAAE